MSYVPGIRGTFIGVLGVLTLPQFAFAHPFAYGALNTELIAEGNILRFKTEVPQVISYSALGQNNERDLFILVFQNQFTVKEHGTACASTLESFDATSTPDKSFFTGTFDCAEPIKSPEDLSIHNTLFSDYFQRFDHYTELVIDGKKWELVFSPDHQDFPGSVGAAYLGVPFDYFFAVAGRFVWLGMLHIWTGYDHILFLLSVILLVRSLKTLLVLVTSFTIAHSITLLLAGFGFVTITPKIVEPLIALTIAYMAIRNLMTLRRNKEEAAIAERWEATFGFGLIHGLGFAGALRETSIPQKLFAPALLIFNIGIEAGQLAILAVAVPVLWRLDRLPYRKQILIGFSALIAGLALFWFFERIIV